MNAGFQCLAYIFAAIWTPPGYRKMQRATEAIELHNKIGVLLHSIDKTSTGDLITELMARGYDVSSIANQLQAERMPKKVAVAGSKIVVFPSQLKKGLKNLKK